jgi:ketosteroid isomerase-like protein
MSRTKSKARLSKTKQRTTNRNLLAPRARKAASRSKRHAKRPLAVRDNVYEIHVAQSEYREAFNTGDVERLLGVFGPDCTDMSEGVPTFYGEDGPFVLRRRMTRLFAEFNARLGQAVMTVQVLGDTAYSCGLRQLTLQPKRGGPAQVANFRFLELWGKNEAGKWKLQMVIDNAEPPLALPDLELPIPWFHTKS